MCIMSIFLSYYNHTTSVSNNGAFIFGSYLFAFLIPQHYRPLLSDSAVDLESPDPVRADLGVIVFD